MSSPASVTTATTGTATTTAAPTEPQRFIARLQASLGDGSFVRLVLGRPHAQEPTLDKLLARRMVLRGQDHLALV